MARSLCNEIACRSKGGAQHLMKGKMAKPSNESRRDAAAQGAGRCERRTDPATEEKLRGGGRGGGGKLEHGRRAFKARAASGEQSRNSGGDRGSSQGGRGPGYSKQVSPSPGGSFAG